MVKELIKTKGFGGVYFWMQRVAEQYRTKATDLIKEADTLHYQTIEWENMSDQVKRQVLQELVQKMINLGWGDQAKEYFGKEEI